MESTSAPVISRCPMVSIQACARPIPTSSRPSLASASARQPQALIPVIQTDGPATANERYAQGFRLVTLQSDVRYMVNGATAAPAAPKSGSGPA